ncbi:hypothetical protein KDX31_10805 [Amphritea atlantica]|uniref:Uncharacterized protein n=1 Tax=Amphritea atlantica TaxID=355243 RepID=A0ABY5GQM5_9GAMM|nr:hypothetical protein KDX31_10805 [Amphritea atlantica]
MLSVLQHSLLTQLKKEISPKAIQLSARKFPIPGYARKFGLCTVDMQ